MPGSAVCVCALLLLHRYRGPTTGASSMGLHDRRACGEIVTEMLTIIRHSGGESRAVKTRVAMYVDVMFFMPKSESI